jgi:prevent-host-death family protein
MESIAISKFKATCLAVLERVRRSRRPVRVTRFGKPIADIVPPAPPAAPKEWLGSLAGSAVIARDIVSPVAPAKDWDALG